MDITIRQHFCEVLYAAGRIKEAGESLLDIANKDVYMTGPTVTWVSGKSCYLVPPLYTQQFATDFLNRYLSTSESTRDTTLHSPSPTPILREWAKSKLTSGSWGDALVSALNVGTTFVLKALVRLTLCWSGVYNPAIHDLLGSLRPSRNDQSHKRCHRVFPPNGQ